MGADRGERTPAEPLCQGGGGGGAAGGDGGLQGRFGDGAARRLCGAHAQTGQRQVLRGIPAKLTNHDFSGQIQIV